jgi:hypothetical protein
VHGHLAIADRDFGNRRGLRAKRRGHGHAARAGGAIGGLERPALPSAGEIDHGLEQGGEPRVAGQQMLAHGVGILPALIGQFIEKGFIEEVVHRIADRTPIGQRGRAFHEDLGNARIGHGIALAGQAFERAGVDLATALVGNAFARAFGGADRLDRQRHAGGIERAAKAHRRHRPQRIAQEFLLARPDQLDRALTRFGQSIAWG